MKLVQQLCVAVVAGVVFTAGAQTVKVGEASYWLAPQSGEKVPPAAPHRTPELLKTAAQTNQWYSTLIFNAQPEVVFAQPLTVKVATTGFELALPSKEVVPTVRRDVEIHYPHRDPLVFLPTGFKLDAHQLAKASDWSIDVAMGAGSDALVATVSHGSPYVYFKLNRGDIRVQMPATSARVDNPADPRVLVLNVKGKRYAVFGPQGVQWEAQGADAFVGRLPAGKGYFSAAAMPDAKPETLAKFTQHAYAFIQDTKVAWRYDQAQSRVETTFTATTQAMEGSNTTPLLGLYPHHWFRNASVADRLGPAFDTLRGSIRTLAASEFKTTQSYLGWVPFWPAVAEQADGPKLSDVMSKDVRDSRRMLRQGGNGPYWQGKGLMRVIKLMDVVEQQGDLKERDRLLALVKDRMEDWFSGKDSKTYFQYDEKLGTMVAHPEEYFSIEQMNDHHFHYGYWIRAAAEIALRDPAWASKERWGGMVDKLIADIANPVRGEKAFPFLRNFDPYEAHSWASGIGLGEFGNNQESSSEAVNAWAGLILWGEVTGNKAVRDLGRLSVHQRSAGDQPLLVRRLQAGLPARIQERRDQHGVRRQVRPQHLVDRRAAPDQGHQPVADQHRRDLPRSLPRLRPEKPGRADSRNGAVQGVRQAAARTRPRPTSGRTSSPSTRRWPTRRRHWPSGSDGARWSWVKPAPARFTGC